MEYKKLTYKMLDEHLSKSNTSVKQQFVMYTGLTGMLTFNLFMVLEMLRIKGKFIPRYFFNNFKRVGFIYLNLVEKKGKYRVKISSKKSLIEFYENTRLIFQTDNIEDINNYIKYRI